MKDITDDWASYVGKEFKGKRSGKYKVVKHEIYRSKSNEWDDKNALYIKVLSSEGEQVFPLLTDVLILMKERFKPSSSMDEAFNLFCKENNIPKLPSQHTVESYYVSFYENFLNDNQLKIESSESKSMMEAYMHGYLPTKDDFESAYRALTHPGETISIDSVLDQMEINVKKNGLLLKKNWSMITEKNIEIWSKKR